MVKFIVLLGPILSKNVITGLHSTVRALTCLCRQDLERVRDRYVTSARIIRDQFHLVSF
jgi:hypothetical protein